MHCCASSPAKEEPLIPWTRDPSGRLQSQKKSEFRRTTDLPCHASTVQIGARSGKIGSSRIYRQLKRLQGRTLGVAVPITLDSRSDRIASACRLSGPVAKLQGARCLCEQCRSVTVSGPGRHTVWVKTRNTQNEQFLSAMP